MAPVYGHMGDRFGRRNALLALTRSSRASLGTAAFGGHVFVLLKIQPGHGEAGAGRLQLEAPAPERVTHACHIVYGVLARVAALGAWAGTRVPAVRLTGWDEVSPSITE